MYFRELDEKYTTRIGYIALRSIVILTFGMVLLVAHGTLYNVLFPFLGTLIIVDGVIIALPIVFDKTTRNLWKIILVRESLQILVGLLFIFNESVSFAIIVFLLVSLLFFRGVIQFILSIEPQTRAVFRRRLFFTSLIFFFMSGLVLVSGFMDGSLFPFLVGVYLVWEGFIHLFNIYQKRNGVRLISFYDESILANDTWSKVDLEEQLNILKELQSKPQKSFLLPHLDTNKYHKILILTPHPDDLEAFAGGLAYRLSGEIVSVIFAGGDKGVWAEKYEVIDQDDYIEIRLDESTQAAHLLGIREIIYMGFVDQEVVLDENAIERTLKLLNHHKPDLVVSFEYYERANPYPHPDHIATANIVRHAIARYADTANLDYLLVSTLIPNRFLNITNIRHIKLEAIACHSTQNAVNKLIFPFLEKALSSLWGAFADVDYAEGYRKVDIKMMREKLKYD